MEGLLAHLGEQDADLQFEASEQHVVPQLLGQFGLVGRGDSAGEFLEGGAGGRELLVGFFEEAGLVVADTEVGLDDGKDMVFVGLGIFEVVLEALEEVDGLKALVAQPEFLHLLEDVFGVDGIIVFMLVGFVEGDLGSG